ncbi:MAG: hypothetical protein D6B27_05140 [Gammaproteobacteria bacterium]|nr:MAG: hypothetical protein D6B27_05140 [Gammaproteobacteria bacterium]
MKNICINYKKERGAILVVSLLMLLMLTIIGVASIKTTTIQERMAGNLRDRELAFQAAEAALTVGENYIITNIETTGEDWITNNLTSGSSDAAECTPVSGLCKEGQTLDPFDGDVWDTALSATAQPLSMNEASDEGGGEAAGVLESPKYIIQLVGTRTVDSSTMTNYIFKVTAKGFGGDANSEVVLQSTFSYIL